MLTTLVALAIRHNVFEVHVVLLTGRRPVRRSSRKYRVDGSTAGPLNGPIQILQQFARLDLPGLVNGDFHGRELKVREQLDGLLEFHVRPALGRRCNKHASVLLRFVGPIDKVIRLSAGSSVCFSTDRFDLLADASRTGRPPCWRSADRLFWRQPCPDSLTRCQSLAIDRSRRLSISLGEAGSGDVGDRRGHCLPGSGIIRRPVCRPAKF